MAEKIVGKQGSSIGREPEGSAGTKLVNKAHGDFWEGIHP